MANTQNRNVNIYYNNKMLGKTPAELRKEYYKLNNEISHMDRSSRDYQKTAARMSRVDAHLKKHYESVRGVNRAWQQTKSVMLGAVGAASGLMIFQKIITFIPEMLQRNADLSDSYADVMKTTGMTEMQVQDLDKTLRNLDTRSSRKELLELAYTAGKLGNQGKRDVLDFVEAADIINVALGEDLGEGALLQIGKLAGVFGLKDKYGLKEGMLKTASAINELGMSSEAAEGFMVDFSKRLAGISGIAKVSIEDNLALAATLDALGQRAETSSTAISKVLTKMGSETKAFAEVAGMELEAFSNLMNENIMEALIAVLEGVEKNSDGWESLSNVLGDLEADGGRIVGVLGTLSKNTKLLREQQQISTKAFQENISVLDEFNVKNTTLGAIMDKNRKIMGKLFSNSGLVNGVKELALLWNKIISPKVSDGLEDQRRALRRLEFQIYDTNTPASERVKLIKELKKEYPDLLGSIDAETISNRQLQQEINKVNESMLLRIRTQRLMEKAADKAGMAANYSEFIDRGQTEIKDLMTEIGDASGQYGIRLNPDAGDFDDQVKDMIQQFATKEAELLEVLKKSSTAEWTKQAARDLLELRDDLIQKYEVIQSYQGVVNGYLEEEKAIREKINEIQGETPGDSDAAAMKARADEVLKKWAEWEKLNEEVKGKKVDELSEEEKKKIAKMGEDIREMYEQLLADVSAKSGEVFYSTLSEMDRELIEMNERYEKLRQQAFDALEANKGDQSIDENTRVKREKEILDQIMRLNETHDAEMEAYYAEREKEFLERKEELHNEMSKELMSDREFELTEAEEYYEELLKLLDMHGIDTSNLVKHIEQIKFDIREKYRKMDLEEETKNQQKKRAIMAGHAQDAAIIMDGYGQALQGFHDLNKAILNEEARDQKSFTTFMIALQTAVAIANGVAKAMQASSPYEAIALALGIAGTVASAVAQAVALNKENPTPQYYTGTVSSRAGRALVGEEGMEMIDLPAGSRVNTASRTAEMTNWYSKPTRTFSTDNYSSSLGTSSTSSTGLAMASGGGSSTDFTEMLSEIKKMNKQLEALNEKDGELKFYQGEYERFQQRLATVKYVGTLKK